METASGRVRKMFGILATGRGPERRLPCDWTSARSPAAARSTACAACRSSGASTPTAAVATPAGTATPQTHTYFDLNGGRDFERVIFAKSTLPNVCARRSNRRAGSARRWRWARRPTLIRPVEGHLRLTQACLREFLSARSPIGLITKSTLIRRDRHLLQDLARAAAPASPSPSPIADPHLSRRIEPGVPGPADRSGSSANWPT